MQPGKDINNALNKITSIVFELAQSGRIHNDELNDFNDAMVLAHGAVEDFHFSIRQATEAKKTAAAQRDELLKREIKLNAIIEIAGITARGRIIMMEWPVRFLVNTKRAMMKHKTAIADEADFLMIERWLMWVRAMIERDRNNISAARVMKTIYHSTRPTNRADEMRRLARTIMNQIAAESGHITDGLKDGRTFDELRPLIEQHWYKQLSQMNLLEPRKNEKL